MTSWLVIAAVGLQVVLLGLDLWDNRRTDQEELPLRRGTVLFLLAVGLVFLALQFAGNWLLPSGPALFPWLREQCERRLGLAAAEGPPNRLTVVAMGILLFYGAGFWDYVVHRFFSHSRWFWFTHEYHHVPTRVTVYMPGIMGRPFACVPGFLSSVAVACTLCLPVFGLGWSVDAAELAIVVFAFVVVILTASHSAFLRRFARVHHLMKAAWLTTPQEHLLHHAVESRTNFGNFTTLWDRLFGTYAAPTLDGHGPPHLGLAYDQDFLGTLTLGHRKLPSSWRKRFELGRCCHLAEAAPQGGSCLAAPCDGEPTMEPMVADDVPLAAGAS